MSAIGSITQIPVRFKRPWRNDKEIKDVVTRTATTLTLRDKLEALRSKRVMGFFRAKARQQAGARSFASVVGSSTSAVLALLRSWRHLAVGFFSRKRGRLESLLGCQSKWGKRLRMLPSTLTGGKSMLSTLQRTLGRTFRRSAEKKAQIEREHQLHQVHMYQWVCRTLARLGRSAIATAHKRRRAEAAALLSREVVDRVIKEALVKVVVMRERERLANCVCMIQRLWRRVKSNGQAAIDAKARLLDLLANLPPCLREHQQTQEQVLKTVHDASINTVTFWIRRAAQRLAARLIQRMWRGHCARKRVSRMRDWKLKKFLRRRQRERLRDARSTLLVPSEIEQKHHRERETRRLARQQETPLLPLPRHHQRRRGERATLLEPLPLHSKPPQMSFSTRTKVQCVPFSRFERIMAQDARVNLSNVWVAIPVGHQELPQEREDEAGWRYGELGPLLVGRGRKKKKGGLQTTYDWVPAHLLQGKEEREATASRRRQRATSPSVARHILDF